MTRKDFEAIAAIIAEQNTGEPGSVSTVAMSYLANDLADYLETRNPNFDRARFIRACGL